MKKLYSLSAVNEAIDTLSAAGYTVYSVPGSLLDSFILEAPDADHWNYIFMEEYLNRWSSAYSVRRCSKISKATWKWYEKSLAWWDRAD